MTMVSVNTLRACISPCFTGWETVAVAAALGAEPIPASLENKPRLTPCMIVAPESSTDNLLYSESIRENMADQGRDNGHMIE